MATFRTIVHVAKMTSVAGMERHLLILLPGLVAHGLNARLIILVEPDKPLDDYVKQMEALGVPTDRLVIRSDFDAGLIADLAREMRGADAVHTHLIHADLHGLVAAKRAGISHIFTTSHNDDKFRRYLPIRLMQRWVWSQVSGGIAISEAIRRFVIEVEYAVSTKVHTVYYGLDPDAVPPDPDARGKLLHALGLWPDVQLAASVCRLTEQKGVAYAIQAMQELIIRCGKLHYVIAGDGPLNAELNALVRTSELESRVHFLGWRPDARSLLSAFDVLLVPSLWEGFGLIALEAMAARLPIIASGVSALPEIVVDGQTGYLVPPADPKAIADRLAALSENPDLAKRLGENGRQRLEQTFSVEQMVRETLKVYWAA